MKNSHYEPTFFGTQRDLYKSTGCAYAILNETITNLRKSEKKLKKKRSVCNKRARIKALKSIFESKSTIGSFICLLLSKLLSNTHLKGVSSLSGRQIFSVVFLLFFPRNRWKQCMEFPKKIPLYSRWEWCSSKYPIAILKYGLQWVWLGCSVGKFFPVNGMVPNWWAN